MAIALLGGLAVMRQGGLVPCQLTDNDWRKTSQSVRLGLTIGLPFAPVNGVGLQLTQHQPIQWQSPIAAIIDVLQPAIAEETLPVLRGGAGSGSNCAHNRRRKPSGWPASSQRWPTPMLMLMISG
ncbi:MAG: hypothetical protein ACK44M_00135 [Chloroflexus sp.]